MNRETGQNLPDLIFNSRQLSEWGPDLSGEFCDNVKEALNELREIGGCDDPLFVMEEYPGILVISDHFNTVN